MDDVKIPMPVLISHETFPRTVFRLHDAAYDEWVMILVSTGRFEFTMLGQRRIAGPGDVVVFPQNVRFQRRIIEPIDIHYFVFLWDCPEQQLHRDGFYRYGALSTGSPRRIAEDDRLLRGLGLRNDLRARQLREAMLRDIWLTHLMSVPEESAGGEDPLMDEAVRYIQRTLSERKSCADIAAHFALSPAAFSRRFSAAFGQGPGAYIASQRMQLARNLLSQSDLSIGKISEMCGFENQFYFSSRFKKAFGVCPREYRVKRLP